MLRLTPIRQSFPRPVLTDVEGEARAAVRTQLSIAAGARIAIAVGSRGIANLDRIVAATVASVRELGGEPFIIPAMGSHGGATAEGQREVLAGYGVTEARVGCPVVASMEVAELPGAGEPGLPAYMDRHAYESDGVILINRIKPHTDFHDRYESGLVKMAVIGLGKDVQARQIHRFGVRGLVNLVPRMAAHILASGKVLLGLGVVENAYDETMVVEAIAPGRIMDREPELLAIAAANMPRLPVDRLDVLIIDQMGKDISGVGMDTNIIGRMHIRGQPEPARPDIAMIVVGDLTDASHGNATGMGLADITTRRMFGKIDFAATNVNVATSGFLQRAKLPMVAETDAEAVAWALRGSGPHEPDAERVVRIRDTLHVSEMYVSRAVLEEIRDREGVEMVGEPTVCFDEGGKLRAF
ncbi:MAG: DUF2088 domain-containing protein [Gemmatimonadetes bacterium]|nr:DUF2088 domain-containing protein [Gemmatimonadota bacterium]